VSTPDVLPGAWPGKRIGDLEVVRTGVRGGHCPSNPRGWPAAECKCLKCGRPGVIVPLYRLFNGNTTTCGCGACFRPRTSGIRDRIAVWVAEAEDGGRWMTQIRDHFGISGGATGGHLHYLVKAGRLERPARGFYCAPGQVPDPIPAPPPGVFSARSSKAGTSRWKNMDQEQRDQRVKLLTAGRAKAASRRAGNS
jgi:hypothetical protein